MSHKWEKKGRIFQRRGGPFFKSHAMRVIPYLRESGVLRLFFSSRCEEDMMHPTFIDVNPDNPSEVIYVSEAPLMPLGPLGTFDDSGITIASIVNISGKSYCYYTGWKRRRYNVPFELSIGISLIEEDGDRFLKLYDGPIISQNPKDPLLVAGPFVINENGLLKMWYCSGTSWAQYGELTEPIYTVFYAESENGIDWKKASDEPCIKYNNETEVVSAPWVVHTKSGYTMFYPYRQSETPLLKRYSIGMAVSNDGVKWIRRDDDFSLKKSGHGWDSEMICYPAVFSYKDKTYLFYSGNRVGYGGIGYAVSKN